MKKLFSTILLTLLLSSMLTLGLNVEPVLGSGIIYIRADGSVDPPTAQIHRVGDIYTLTDNIVVSIGVEKDNVVIDGAGYIIDRRYALGSAGIVLIDRSNVTIRNVTITKSQRGISLFRGSGNIIQGNTLVANLLGIKLAHGSKHIIIDGNSITNNGDGIVLDSICEYNSIVGNNITANNEFGIMLSGYSNNNNLSRNTIASNQIGVWLDGSSNNTVSGNNITANNDMGIFLDSSVNNSITLNTIANNHYGVKLWWSSDNVICHNNFVNNGKQVLSEYSINSWDYGYPNGGNYWSDYDGRYPNASQIDDSGFWDTPYVIDEDNQDCYR